MLKNLLRGCLQFRISLVQCTAFNSHLQLQHNKQNTLRIAESGSATKKISKVTSVDYQTVITLK